MRFYFTYAQTEHPFPGGWTTVEAPDLDMACKVFRLFHPDKPKGLIHCAGIYPEEQFVYSNMYRQGNFGKRCQEFIALTRTALE